MLLKKIRESLGVALALIAALSSAYGFITGLRNDSLMSELTVVNNNNELLAGVNQQNAKAIKELIDQRVIDDKLIAMLNNQYKKLADDSQVVRTRLQEIKAGDTEFQALLIKRHPVELSKLLNKRAGDNPDGNSDTSTVK